MQLAHSSTCLSRKALRQSFGARSATSHLNSCRRARGRPARILVKAELDSGTVLAVMQQGAAFVAVVLGEGFYTRTQQKPGEKGRPSIPTFALSSVAIVAVSIDAHFSSLC